jgi:hypothetical protein
MPWVEYTVENLAEKQARSKPYVFILESIKWHLHCTAYLSIISNSGISASNEVRWWSADSGDFDKEFLRVAVTAEV